MKSKLKKKRNLLLLLLNTVTYTSLSLLSNKIHLCFPKVLLSHFSTPPPRLHLQFFFLFFWCGSFFLFFLIFIEFVTILFLFYVFLFFWLQCMCDLSFPTRDWTHTPSPGSQSPNHWPTREVPTQFWWIMFRSIQRSSKLYLSNFIMENTAEWAKHRDSTQMSLDSNPGFTTNSYMTWNDSIISPNLSFLMIK